MNEAQWLWTGLLVLSVLGSAVSAIATLTGRASRTQIDGEVRIASTDDFVERREFDESFETLKREIADVRNRHEVADDKLRHEIKSVSESLTRTKDELQAEASRRASNMHRRLDEMNAEIRGIPQHVVALLKDTKNLI